VKTIRHLIYSEILRSVAFVTLGFLSLFFFFDFVDELQSISRSTGDGYGAPQALAYVALLIPSHLYELLPIAVLIGTIFVMARLAQSSEYTILRTSGLGPWRALRTLLVLGLGFVVLTFAVGDYAAPYADRAAQLLKTRFRGEVFATTGNTGAWLKERQGAMSYAVNVSALNRDGTLATPRIFEFDARGYVASQTSAASARIDGDAWLLTNVERQQYDVRNAKDTARIVSTHMPELRWPTTLTSEMVSVALLKPDRMPTIDLFEYIRHLEANGQTAQRYEISRAW
jgi:lipopolysaccharide export system permease protein